MQLEVRNISYDYGSSQALSDISFKLEGGRFHALLGLNGAGKTTLFGLITRLLALQSGDIQLSCRSLRRHPSSAMKLLGAVFQQSALDLDLTVQQNLEYHAALHGFGRKEAGQRIGTELDRFHLSDHATAVVRSLNGGHRRRIEIARSLLHQPSILLLDEPSTGLDVATREALIQHVHQLVENEGLTVLWATHLFDEVLPTDNVLILDKGRLLADEQACTLVRRLNAITVKEAFSAVTKERCT